MDVNKLRELAQKATPGPWKTAEEDVRLIETPDQSGTEEYVAGTETCANAAFIAAANPAAILELLDRLEAAERDAKRYRALRDSKHQLDEDDICVSDSFFTQYFEEELDVEIDALRARYDAEIY